MIDTPEYRKAREIATWLLGYPYDEEHEQMIEEATPLQAMDALYSVAILLKNKLMER